MKKGNGFTIIELLVTLAIGSILLGISTMNLLAIHNAKESSVLKLTSFIKNARSKAISETRAIRVIPTGDNALIYMAAENCSAKYPDDWDTTNESLILDQGSNIYSITDKSVVEPIKTDFQNWSGVCFSNKGYSSSNVIIAIEDRYSQGTSLLEVFLGGGVKVI